VQHLGIKVVSISGAKGKKLIEAPQWKSQPYRQARAERSAIESLVFTLKEGFEFGEMVRRHKKLALRAAGQLTIRSPLPLFGLPLVKVTPTREVRRAMPGRFHTGQTLHETSFHSLLRISRPDHQIWVVALECV
jgi:hypothetical protein